MEAFLSAVVVCLIHSMIFEKECFLIFGSVSIKDFKSAITLPHAMITLIAIIILLLETTILIKCIRDNIKLKKVILDTKELSNTIYDEIADRSPPGSPCVGTESNIAYEQAIKVV